MNQKTIQIEFKENKINCDVSVAIVTASSRKRNSLRILLRAMSQLGTIDLMADTLSTLQLGIDHPPDLLVLDLSLSGNGDWTILEQVKTEWPQTQCLVLVDTIQQQRMAQEANADGILINGFSIDEFFTLVNKLLSGGNGSKLQEHNIRPD
ncbi:MAG: hypothetical protein GY832_05480 [Chloroflexi bacterium]|nr:hypothetical protein [Chloroflexota bacterium]